MVVNVFFDNFKKSADKIWNLFKDFINCNVQKYASCLFTSAPC